MVKQGSAEGIVGRIDPTEGQNMKQRKETRISMTRKDAEGRDGNPGAPVGGSGRNPREQREGVSKVTARRENSIRKTNRARVGELFLAVRRQGYVRRTRRMDTAQIALHSMETVETIPHAGQKPDEAGTSRRSCMEIGHKRSRSLVECRGIPHERSFPEEIL